MRTSSFQDMAKAVNTHTHTYTQPITDLSKVFQEEEKTGKQEKKL